MTENTSALALTARVPRTAGAEDGVQQEQGVTGLGRDAGDAADGDVRAPGAVQKIEVDVDRGAVAAQPDGELAVHLVEVQGVFAVVAGRAADRLAGAGRHIALRLDPGGGDLRGFLHPGGEYAVADQEDVRAETGAFVPCGYLGDHSGDRYLPESGDVSAGDDDVVELQVRVFVQRYVEAERGRVLGAEDSANVRLHCCPGRLGHSPSFPDCSDISNILAIIPARGSLRGRGLLGTSETGPRRARHWLQTAKSLSLIVAVVIPTAGRWRHSGPSPTRPAQAIASS